MPGVETNSVTDYLAAQIAKLVLTEMRETPGLDTPWLTEEGAARYLSLKPRGMQNHRRQDTGPVWCKAGVVRYHKDRGSMFNAD